MVFLAIVIPAAVHGLAIAHRAGVVAERKSVAGRLADSLLTDVVLTESWRDAESEGDFGDDWPGYSWALREDYSEQEGMLLLTVEVSFQVQANEQKIFLSTFVPEVSE